MISKTPFSLAAIFVGSLLSSSVAFAKPAGPGGTSTRVPVITVVATATAVATYATQLGPKTVCVIGTSTTWGTPGPAITVTSVIAGPVPVTSTAWAVPAVPTSYDGTGAPPIATTIYASVNTLATVRTPESTEIIWLTPTSLATATALVGAGTAVTVDFPSSQIFDGGATIPVPDIGTVLISSLATMPLYTTTFNPLATTDGSGATTIFVPIPSATMSDGTWCDYVEVDGTNISIAATATAITTATAATSTTTSVLAAGLNQGASGASGAMNNGITLSVVTSVAGGLLGILMGLM